MPQLRGVVARFQQRHKEQQSVEEQVDQPKLLIVPCNRHDIKRSHAPFLLSSKLQDKFEGPVLVRVISKAQPQLRLFFRASAKVFVPSVLEGISIMQEILDQGKIFDKQVELQVAERREASLSEVAVLILDHYLSQRDIWHLHAAMMQDGGQILYANFDYMLRQLVPNSRIDRLISMATNEPVLSGLVDHGTEVSFKSTTANMVVLVQISSELFEYGLMGRPYWEALIECFMTLVDKSLRVTRGSGHYIRMIMFTRIRGVPLSPDVHVDQDLYAKPKTVKDGDKDFYDVFWEGFARVMPSTAALAGRIRRVCMRLHEEKHGRVAKVRRSDDDWSGLQAHAIVEAAQGNILESMNLVLDIFDRHHLDRMLRSTGQAMVLLTAGNGLIESPSRDLYDLTYRRFAITRPMTCQIVCARGPPMHPVPWVQWPGGPRYDAPTLLIEEDLPCSPPWIQIAFYPEVRFCPCRSEDWVLASFMPLLTCERKIDSPSIIPHWSEAERTLRNPPAWSGKRARSKETSKIKWADRNLWEQLRTPALRSFFNRSSGDDGSFKYSTYVLAPSRFDYTDLESEKINVIHDLVGLRLEVTPGAQLFGFDEQALHKSSLRLPAGEAPSPRCNSPNSKDCDMLLNGELVPKALRSLVVRTSGGSNWKFESQNGPLEVFHQEEQEKECHAVYPYSFYVRRQLVRQHRAEVTSEAEHDRGSSAHWISSRVRFHAPNQPDWNALDNVVAGGLTMPAALPYPVRAGFDGLFARDPCIGWTLRSALKQNLFVLKPPGNWSHLNIYERALQRLRGESNGPIDVGTDFFLVLQNSGEPVIAQEIRQQTLENFLAFKADLEKLCFGRRDPAAIPQSSPREHVPETVGALDINLDSTGHEFKVERGRHSVYIKEVDIPTSFAESRDWFELFFDDVFAPPKLFNIVIQWLVCSSVHMVHFVSCLFRIAEKHGFSLIRLPIAQLFPPPAPHWVWGDDCETDLDRLALYPRRKISLPNDPSIFEELLRCWLAPPLEFHFVYATQKVAFQVEDVKELKTPLKEKRHDLFQRLKGWVLCDADGLCLVALRETAAYYENRLLFSDARDPRIHEEKLERIEELRCRFYRATDQVLADHAKKAAQMT